MKRKIFSKLLMVAMLVASVSMFVSCKDYDDDIKKNSDAISSLQQTLNNLQSALDQAKSDAATAHATFATKVELGQVDTAVKALQDEIKNLAKVSALEDAIAEVNAAIAKGATATKEELEALSTQVAAINTELDAIGLWKETTDAAIKTANANIKEQQEALAALALVVASGDQANSDAIAALKTALEKAIKDGDDKNAADVKTLQDALAALETASKAGDKENTDAINALAAIVGSKTDATGLFAEIKKLEDKIAELASKTDDKSALEALTEQVKAKATIADVNDLKTALTEQITAAVNDIADVNEKLEAMASDINDVKEAMKNADDAVRKDIGDQINLLQVFISKRLTSLVFKPQLYWGGIEAIECPAVIAAPLWTLVDNDYVGKATASDVEKSESWTRLDDYLEEPDSVYSIIPLVDATYHMNPSTAQIAGQKYSFVSNIVRTRAIAGNSSSLAVPGGDGIIKAEDYSNGLLTVSLKPDWEHIAYLAFNGDSRRNGWVNVDDYWYSVYTWMTDSAAMVALKVEVNDTVVVSDYARLAPAFYRNLVIADNKWEEEDEDLMNAPFNHLYPSVVDRINSDEAVHEVYYGGSLNLTKYIETHYNLVSEVTDQYDHEVMSDEIREKLGLHYEYAIIDYTLGNNKTSESAHIELGTENDSVYAYPRNVNAKGETIKGETANASAAGRKPIIRVTLEDSEGRIYSFGYLKIEIVEEDIPEVKLTADFTFENTVYLNCEDAAKLTWSQVEYHIYNDLLQISKTNFEQRWWLDCYLNENNVPTSAKQYVIDDDGEYVPVDEDDILGPVTEATDPDEPTTNVLQWAFNPATEDAYKAIKKAAAFDAEGKSTKDLSTIVAFRSSNNSVIYVTLKLPKTQLVMAAGALGKKLKAYWYDLNNGVAQSGVKEIHATAGDPDRDAANANVTASDRETCEDGFQFNINSTFYGNKIGFALSDEDHFDEFLDENGDSKVSVSLKFTYPSTEAGNAAFNATAVPQAGYKVKSVENTDVTVLGYTAGRKYWTVYGNTGNEYVLTLTDDAKQIVAVTTLNSAGKAIKVNADAPYNYNIGDTAIVTLSTDTDGKWTATLNKESDIAKDILNYAIHSDLASKKTFTAYVEAETESEACSEPIFNEKYFNIRYIRPITVTGAEGKSIEDAAGTQKFDITKFINWGDWRSTSTAAKWDYWYYEYYGVKLNYDLNETRTDIDDPAATALAPDAIASIEALAKLSDATSDLALSSEGAVDGKGSITWTITPKSGSTAGKATPSEGAEITYDHNEAAVGNFHLYIPVTVSYFWGKNTQKFYAVITVKKTTGEGNSARHR